MPRELAKAQECSRHWEEDSLNEGQHLAKKQEPWEFEREDVQKYPSRGHSNGGRCALESH
ncbi:hypothetical protein I79_004080 [Cricetulus griseus]|uniref:Uncharacterized protein n=1 Tax=Cricetulus griseus TaxID=10029 RepID=G3H1P8_CRIGR|nr:hypothetical protein I79_004080 [Cricetulus griseus]